MKSLRSSFSKPLRSCGIAVMAVLICIALFSHAATARLVADNQINLTAAQNTATQSTSSSSSASLGVGFSLGTRKRQELVELCRKVRQLQMERDILSTAGPSLQAEASRRSQRLHADPSPGLRAGTTPGGFIRHWTTCRPITLRGNTVNRNHHRQNHQNNRRPKTAYPPHASHLWTRRFRA